MADSVRRRDSPKPKRSAAVTIAGMDRLGRCRRPRRSYRLPLQGPRRTARSPCLPGRPDPAPQHRLPPRPISSWTRSPIPRAVRVTLTTKPLPKGATHRRCHLQPQQGHVSSSSPATSTRSQTYKTYELWIIPSDGTAPMPAGTFHPDDQGNASVVMPDLPKGVPAKAFGVTIEDDGGSQTPTFPIIMAGS